MGDPDSASPGAEIPAESNRRRAERDSSGSQPRIILRGFGTMNRIGKRKKNVDFK